MNSTQRLILVTSSLVLLVCATTPSLALCKYGTPHCIDLHPGPSLPEVSTNRLPDSPPGDDDCKYYGSCDDGSPEGTGPDGGQNGGLGTDTGAPWTPALKPGHHRHLVLTQTGLFSLR